MKKSMIVAALLAWAMPAEAAKFEIRFQAGQEQVLRMQRGRPVIESSNPASDIRVEVQDGPIKKRGQFLLLVYNNGAVPFDLGPENVSAHLADGTAVEIVPYERLRKEEKNRDMWRSIGAGLAAANNNIAASNAGRSSGTGTFQANSFGPGGMTTTTGTATWTADNPAQAAQARAAADRQNQQIYRNAADAREAGMAALESFLRTSTVDPRAIVGGMIVFELPKVAQASKSPVPVTFVITTAGQSHVIQSTLIRQ